MNTDTHDNAGEINPASDSYQKLASGPQDAAQLQRQITDLLEQLDTLRNASKARDSQESLVSQLRQANENLVHATLGAQDQQATAEAANLAKEEFLSMLALELRNPLAPIVMAAELMGNITEAHPQLPKLHGIITRQANHLTHLVDDLLDASRVNSGKFLLKKSVLRLRDVIESAIETSQPMIAERTQRLTVDFPAADLIVDGDPVRLAQVFSNLLINASKFTPEHGHICISGRSHAGVITVSIVDDGVGISAEIQPFIFDLFTQGPHTLDRSLGGLGIGLALVRTIVEMHGGSATMHSAGAGTGSEFIVLLPVSNAEVPVDRKAETPVVPVACRRILIIEDNADANETLKNFLTFEGHAVSSALNGTLGIAMARENNYDVIICDLGLPGMDGYEVVVTLRLCLLAPLPCFIAVTGYNQVENRIHAIDAGFDHYLVKPVAVDILLNLIGLCKLQ